MGKLSREVTNFRFGKPARNRSESQASRTLCWTLGQWTVCRMMCARDPLLAEEQKWLAEAAEPELLIRRAARPPAGVPVIPPAV